MEDNVLPKMEIISEKLVKPSSATPPSSKYYKLSYFDAILLNAPGTLALFYSKETFNGIKPCMEVLEASLSKTLDYYYLFAGRLAEDKISIECNDAGVKLWEVQIQASKSEILDAPADYNLRNIVFPRQMYHLNQDPCCVMIQVNHFTCGGICLAVSMSHELGDAQTLFNFINQWAMITFGSYNIHPTEFKTPIFSGTSFFPPLDHSQFLGKSTSNPFFVKKITTVTRRFVFSASSISELKKMVTRNDKQIENPSKVEVVTALIFKCAVSAFIRVSCSFKPSSLVHAVNIRPLTKPPLSDHYLGNLLTLFSIRTTDEREIQFSNLVSKLKKSKCEVQNALRSTCPGESELFSTCIKKIMRKLIT